MSISGGFCSSAWSSATDASPGLDQRAFLHRFRAEGTEMTVRCRRMAQAVLVCVVLVTELVPAFSNSPLTIAVILSREAAPYRQALRGFEEVLRGSGRSYKLLEFSAEGVAVEPSSLAAKVRARRPDLILTIGTGATTTI